MLQPDFGTGTVIVMTIVGLLFVGRLIIAFFLELV